MIKTWFIFWNVCFPPEKMLFLKWFWGRFQHFTWQGLLNFGKMIRRWTPTCPKRSHITSFSDSLVVCFPSLPAAYDIHILTRVIFLWVIESNMRSVGLTISEKFGPTVSLIVQYMALVFLFMFHSMSLWPETRENPAVFEGQEAMGEELAWCKSSGDLKNATLVRGLRKTDT